MKRVRKCRECGCVGGHSNVCSRGPQAVISMRGPGPGGWQRYVSAVYWPEHGLREVRADYVFALFKSGYSMRRCDRIYRLPIGTTESVVRWYGNHRDKIPRWL